MTDSNPTSFDVLLDCLESIRKTCMDISSPLSYEDNNLQAVYMSSMYSIVVELVDDAYQALKARKELASHVLTRALLEAVVDLCNVVKNPNYVIIRFQKALVERRKKLIYLMQKEPELILEAGRSTEYVQSAVDKIDKLLDRHARQPSIRQRFKDADMEDYYDTGYSLLCDYAHHDGSAIVNRHIGLTVRPLSDKSLLMLSDLISNLLLKATIAVHDFLHSDRIDTLKELQSKWKVVYREQAVSIPPVNTPHR